jgi:hypothetical protein
MLVTGDFFIAYCYSVILLLSFFPALIQILLLSGAPYWLPLFELGALMISGYFLYNNGHAPGNKPARGSYFYLPYFPVVFILGIMLLQAVVLIPLNHDCLTYNIARTSLDERHKHVFCRALRHGVDAP